MSKNIDELKEVFCPNCLYLHTVETRKQEETYTIHGKEITVLAERTFCTGCDEMIGTDEQDEKIIADVKEKYFSLEE